MSTSESLTRPPPQRSWRLWVGLALVSVAVLSIVSSFFIRWKDVFIELKDRQAELRETVGAHPLLASAAYFLIYVLFAGLALPGAPILTLLGGAIFGVWWGVLLISFGSTAGATLSFLASRYLLRERVQAKYGDRLQKINQELDRSGSFYLLSLRLNPVVPFFLINLLFGLTRMPAHRFWWVSQLGMLPGTIIYTNAGAQLAEIDSLSGILSWPLLLSLLALSIFPLIARMVASRLNRGSANRG